MSSSGRTYTIGQVSERTGLTVKTIRYYSDIGLLPVLSRTSGGFRTYDDTALTQANIVQSLRDLGLGLNAIKHLTTQPSASPEVLSDHLQHVEDKLRNLQRMRTVLRAVEDHVYPEGDCLLQLIAMSRIDTAHMFRVLSEFFSALGEEAPQLAGWLSGLARASVSELPSDPSTEQIDAWVELSHLLLDETFRSHVRHRCRASFVDRRSLVVPPNPCELPSVVAAFEKGVDPYSTEASAAAQEYLIATAAAHPGVHASDIHDKILRAFEAHDPREARFWHLISLLNNWTGPAPSDPGPLYQWLKEAIAAKSSGEGGSLCHELSAGAVSGEQQHTCCDRHVE